MGDRERGMSGDNWKRPVNLDLRTIRMAVGAGVSILHRVTGVVLVASIPVLLYVLQQSLVSAEAYAQQLAWFGSGAGRGVLFVLILVLAHHLLAGVRHLLLDLGIGGGRVRARQSAWLVFAGVGAAAIIGGGWLLS